MGHVVAKKDWGTIDIDTDTGVILVREDWLYFWQFAPGYKPFTLAQKRAFHKLLDREIWQKWSNQFRVHAEGQAPFAKKFTGRTLLINFDVRWVLRDGQWRVYVVNLPSNHAPGEDRAGVIFQSRDIYLFSTSNSAYDAITDDKKHIGRNVHQSPHEFGHTLDYPDDYHVDSVYSWDVGSIMNVGQQVRNRHIWLIIDTLNTMIPGVTFAF